jgi:hypothetical protein|tara:strand:+ start:383 stop:655 length:273 start_codon:yes stop_codon:yes gene_type:complete
MLNEADILVNAEIKVTSPRSQWFGHLGRVNKVMADGRTLEVRLDSPADNDVIFIDVTLVRDLAWLESAPHAKGEPNLGPDANSLLPVNKI